MKSKSFYLGVFGVVWFVAFLISTMGPGDSGNLLLAMLSPVVIVASVVGLIWGIVERRKSQGVRSRVMIGIVLNGLIVGLAAIGLGGWLVAAVWPRLPFRFPHGIPVYPGTTILSKKTTRDSAGALSKSWELFAYPEYDETTPQHVKAALFYDQQLPKAVKRIDGGGVHYSYVGSNAKRVEITVTTTGVIRIRESSE